MDGQHTVYRQLGFDHQVVVHDHQFITVEGSCKKKFGHITNKKQALSNSHLAEYLFKVRILSQFLMTIKELDPIKND
ncbi:hypothetical protein HZS_2106 [Henneguya salminicola]|nr:hypothetical protein HZS_2106 [Henneguya salminicola]